MALKSVPVGYHGLVFVFGNEIKATSVDININQKQTFPNPSVSEPDFPMWHGGPTTIEGSINFILTGTEFEYNIIRSGISRFASRPGHKVLSQGAIDVFWPAGFGVLPYTRSYTGSLIDKVSFNAVAVEPVQITIDVMSTGFSESSTITPSNTIGLRRTLSWDDILIQISNTIGIMESCDISEFSFTIENNCQPIFTYLPIVNNETLLNASASAPMLFPKAIATGLRKVTGNITFLGPSMGRQAGNLFISQLDSFNTINMNINAKGKAGSPFGLRFNKVTWVPMNIAINSDVVTSRMEWMAHGNGPSEDSIDFLA